MMHPPCRICHSDLVAHVREVPMRRMKHNVPLYYCLECESFQHPQVYTEPDHQLRKDSEWHISVEDRNTKWSNNLFNTVLKHRAFDSVVEIGCGIGTTLAVAKARGLEVQGYDTNPYVSTIARERHGLEISSDRWNRDQPAADLVLCISVFEHLPDPHTLMGDIAAFCRLHGSPAIISVPFITERSEWGHLREDVPSSLTNPLYLCDVHLTHFSRRAFEAMARQHGARQVEPYPFGWLHNTWLEF